MPKTLIQINLNIFLSSYSGRNIMTDVLTIEVWIKGIRIIISRMSIGLLYFNSNINLYKEQGYQKWTSPDELAPMRNSVVRTIQTVPLKYFYLAL